MGAKAKKRSPLWIAVLVITSPLWIPFKVASVISRRIRLGPTTDQSNGGAFASVGSVDAQPAYVYLLSLGSSDLTKVGITRSHDYRVGHHARNGWSVVKSWQVPSLGDARRIEREVLAHAQTYGALTRDTDMRGAMPQGGYTEVMTLPAAYLTNLIESKVPRSEPGPPLSSLQAVVVEEPRFPPLPRWGIPAGAVALALVLLMGALGSSNSPAHESTVPTSDVEGVPGASVRVPQLVGLTLLEVEEALDPLGLEAETTDDTGQDRVVVVRRNWKVVSQTPGEGAEVAAGSVVQLRIVSVRDDDTESNP